MKDAPVTKVCVLPTCPDPRLRGYVGEIVDWSPLPRREPGRVLVRFVIKIQNEIAQAWVDDLHLTKERHGEDLRTD